MIPTLQGVWTRRSKQFADGIVLNHNRWLGMAFLGLSVEAYRSDQALRQSKRMFRTTYVLLSTRQFGDLGLWADLQELKTMATIIAWQKAGADRTCTVHECPDLDARVKVEKLEPAAKEFLVQVPVMPSQYRR